MPFIGRKLFAKKLPSAIIGKFNNEKGREDVVGEAIACGILELYHVPNPTTPGTQTSAIRLNRKHEFVQSVLSSLAEK